MVEPPKPTVPRKGRPGVDVDPILRLCARHGLVAHGWHRGGKDGPRLRCKRCVGEAVTRRHQKIRQILVAEAGGCCAICGYARCIFNLHFHHVDPAQKTLQMNMGTGRALARFREEAKKCVLLCANCHGEVESGLVPSPPAGATYQTPGRSRAQALGRGSGRTTG